MRFSCILPLISLAISCPVFSQKTYFQQQVNTKIRVSLDDEKHRLAGNIEIEYINNSPDALKEIWLHVWPNAYASRTSAMAKQFLRLGIDKFHFATNDERGGLEDLNFQVNGAKTRWSFHKIYKDVVQIRLAEDLPPGGKITISTPLNLKIPASFSRLGHVGQSYQITQWFPKPAVYDLRGWHAMPYLNMGEFYSEFGNYEVEITLPRNYVVGATGVCQTNFELQFLKKKTIETQAALAVGISKLAAAADSFPPSDSLTKTIRFTAENVHDFAWFADKRFMVTSDSAVLPSGKVVPTWAFFTKSSWETWQRGAFFVRRAIEFYSKNVGEYPWPQASAVNSALSAGGGMEYPMITVINNERSEKALDDVITHEVGHNWFYGLLASNERDHPWMDEGMNSFYEYRYMKQHYPSAMYEDMLPKWLLNSKTQGEIMRVACLTLARQGFDTPPDSPSDEFSMASYGVQAYAKTALFLQWLEQSVGVEKFDRAMQDYFQKWKFKHPYPADFQKVMEENGLNSGWFMDAMRTTKQADFLIKTVAKTDDGELQIWVKNKGKLDAPFVISALKNGEKIAEKWYEPLDGKTNVRFPMIDSADNFVIDFDNVMMDINRKNNLGGLMSRPPKFKIFAPFEIPRRTLIGVLPWVGWNNYDKAQIGVILYNPPLPGQRFQIYLAPGFATGTGELVGFGDVRFRWLPDESKFFRSVTMGLIGKSWHNAREKTPGYDLRFTKIQPFLRADWQTPSQLKFWTNVRLARVTEEYAVLQPDGSFFKNEKGTEYLGEVKFHLDRNAKIYPSETELAWEIRNQDSFNSSNFYLRSNFSHLQKWFYQKGKKASARFFFGWFLNSKYTKSSDFGFGATEPVRGSLSLSKAGYTDYWFDEVFFGRTEQTGFLARQISETEGGFKYGFGSGNKNASGHSNQVVLALNLKTDLPFNLPYVKNGLKPYLDLGFAKRPSGLRDEQFFWSGGLLLSFFDENLNFYFPVVNSQNLQDLYKKTEGKNYIGRVSWSVKLNDLEPITLLNRMLK